MKKEYPLYLIEWVDAESDITWETYEKTVEWGNKDAVINEVGWLICKNKKYIVISNQITYDNDIGNRTKIPLLWVKKMKRINLKCGKN